jgi:hypothetical protein
VVAVKHKKKNWQPTKLERRVQAIARRKATRELMQVPWDRFRRSYLAYARWQALTLWTRAIAEAEGRAPSWLAATLKKRCPGLMENEALLNEPGLLAYRLGEWIDTRIFRQAGEEGWLNGLVFFGVRSRRSQATWAYWEDCEKEWDRRRPRAYPAFENWWQTARNYRFCEEATTPKVVDTLERYVKWRAFAYWLRPLLEANRQLPMHVAAELRRRCPGFLEFNKRPPIRKQRKKGEAWQHLASWVDDHFFSGAKKQGWLGIVVRQARNDPRHARLAEFCKRWNKSWFQSPAIAYPSFRQWERAADAYVED